MWVTTGLMALSGAGYYAYSHVLAPKVKKAESQIAAITTKPQSTVSVTSIPTAIPIQSTPSYIPLKTLLPNNYAHADNLVTTGPADDLAMSVSAFVLISPFCYYYLLKRRLQNECNNIVITS